MTNEKPSLDQLIEEYRSKRKALSPKELVIAERQLWGEVPEETRRAVRRGEWFKMIFGSAQQEFSERSALYNAGQAADPIWDRMTNAGMTIYTAARLFRQAKKLHEEESIPVDQAILSVLADYEQLPMKKRADGTVIRWRPPSRLPSLQIAGRDVKKTNAEELGFWAKLRKMLIAFTAERLHGADPIISEKLWREFERDLRILYDDLQNRLSRARKAQRVDNEAAITLTRRQVEDACTTLHMDPPKRGKPVDLVLAKRQKHRLARLYHPDPNLGDESLRPKYDAVIQAFDVLEQYNERLGAMSATECA